MDMRIIFTLSMPGVNSWDGKWSGEGRSFTVERILSSTKWKVLTARDGPYWQYAFGDGWIAGVSAHEAKPGERVSGNFCGYDWMVAEILRHGKILPRRKEVEKEEQGNE